MSINTFDSHTVFKSVLDQLTTMSQYAQKRQEQFGGHDAFPDLETYIREFQTIRFSSPRQCGLTSWLVDNIQSDWIIITPRYFKNIQLTNLRPSPEQNNPKVYSGQDLKDFVWPEEKINTIVLDSSDHVFQEITRAALYKFVASQGHNPNLRLILIN